MKKLIIITAKKAKSGLDKLRANKQATVAWRKKDNELKPFFNLYTKKTNDVWAVQEKKYIKNMKKLVAGQKSYNTKALTDSQIKKEMSLDLKASLIAFMKAYGITDQNNIDLAFKQIQKLIKVETLRPTPENIKRILKSRVLGRENMTAVTNDVISNIVAPGIQSGKSIAELELIIQDKFKQWGKGRALRIARTETVGINNFSQLEAEKESGIVEGNAWLTARDGKVRDTHISAEGQIVKLGKFFIVGGTKLAYPGDPSGGNPAETIECRCSLVPILIKNGKKGFYWDNNFIELVLNKNMFIENGLTIYRGKLSKKEFSNNGKHPRKEIHKILEQES